MNNAAYASLTTITARVAFIKAQLATNDAWLCRAIVVIHEYQTADEQASEATRENNGVGFNSVDAQLMSSFAVQIARGWKLSAKQMPYARRKMIKYAAQLERIARAKREAAQSARAA